MKTLKSLFGYGVLAVALSACGGAGSGEDAANQNWTNPQTDAIPTGNNDAGGKGNGIDSTIGNVIETGTDDRVENTQPNVAPVISGTPQTEITTGAAYQFIPVVTDANNDALSFSITNKPSWANFNTQTGELSGVASVAGATSNVQISVTDGRFLVILAPFNLLVTDPLSNDIVDDGMTVDPTPIEVTNQAPAISGDPTATVKVASAYSFKPTASDADEDALTFAVTSIPAWLNFNTATGELSGQPTSNDQAGVISNIVISVTDGHSVIALPAFSINVQANASPTIGGIAAAQIDEGQAYGFTPVASDDEEDALSFAIANKPQWMAFDSSTGALTGLPEAVDVGTYTNIQISVTDGYSTTALTAFAVEVLAAPINQAPVVSGSPSSVAREGQAYAFTPSVTDPEGELLSFTINNMPTWMLFDSATGAVSGTPTRSDVGAYNGIEISVNDGTNTTIISFSLTVESTSATLSWAAPTTRSDGSALPLSELAGYRIYGGSNANNLTLLANLTSNTSTDYKFSNLSAGTYYYAVASYNIYGVESDRSQVVSKTIN